MEIITSLFAIRPMGQVHISVNMLVCSDIN